MKVYFNNTTYYFYHISRYFYSRITITLFEHCGHYFETIPWLRIWTFTWLEVVNIFSSNLSLLLRGICYILKILLFVISSYSGENTYTYINLYKFDFQIKNDIWCTKRAIFSAKIVIFFVTILKQYKPISGSAVVMNYFGVFVNGIQV